MNLTKYIPNVISSKAARSILLTQKASPTLLFGVGVIGVIATAVLASRATLKLEDVVDETQENLEKAKTLHERGLTSYSDRDYKQDVAVVYIRAIGSVTKLYGPTLLTGVMTIGSLAGSRHILTKRNAGLLAAYKAVEKGFVEYRERVLKEVGPDKERELRYGSETHEIVEETKKGPKVSQIQRVGQNVPSVYAKFFDETCGPSWSRTPEYNRIFLSSQQNWANEMLRARGHLFLNSVYDMLGMDDTQAGAVVGWIISKDGDNFVDFGLYNSDNPKAREFVNGHEGSILLDFNVDGVIYDLI